MEVLAEELGSAFNAEAKAAWTSGLQGLNAGIVKTLKASEDLVDPQTRLSGHMIKDVQRSWENVRGNRNAIVAGIFKKYISIILIYQKRLNELHLNSIGSSLALPAS